MDILNFKTFAFSVLIITIMFGLALTAIAAGPKAPTVVITGGGVVENKDSGLGNLTSVGGFVAIARGTGVLDSDSGVTVWTDVRGQIQAELVDASNLDLNLSTLHGKVVCIAFDDKDYEIRFLVTHSSGELPVPVDSYGSLFVSADGDSADENFDPGEAECGTVGGSAHEPVLSGSFKVRTR